MFVDNLVESRSNRLEARRVAVLPLVAGAHAALAAAMVLASVWSLRYVTEAPIPIIRDVQICRIPPPRAGGPKQDVQAEKPKPIPNPNVTPLVIPSTKPVIYEQNIEGQATEGSGVIGGLGELFGPGEQDELNTGQIPGGIPVPPEPDTGPLRIGEDIQAPIRLTSLTPAYPEPARKAGKQGIVVLRLVISRDGSVTDVQVVSGLPLGLTQAAVDAARNLRFKPAFRASTGQPVECYFDLSVEFRIN